jgi:hypothetical protein
MMIYVLSTCNVIMGKNKEFEETFSELKQTLAKHGGKLVGSWWSFGGEENEAVWLFSWKDLKEFEKGYTASLKDTRFPMEKFASTVISYSNKILKPSTHSPIK